MSLAGTWDYELPPDDPARRVIWVLPLAALLVLLAMLGLTRLLKSATQRPPAPPPPVQAEFYELPGVTGPKPQPGREHPVPAPPAPPAPPPVPRAPPAPSPPVVHAPPKPLPPAPVVHAPPRPAPRPHVRTPPPSTAVRMKRSRGREKVQTARRKVETVRHAAPEAAAPPAPPKTIDWSRISEDVKSAVASTLGESEFQRVRNPHSMVAQYYLAEVLRKLERVGEMSYLGTMVGEVTVIFVIGPDGAVDNLAIWESSGNPELDDYAERIVRMSAPFSPFSDTLERQSMQLKLKVNMVFEGYRDVEAR